MQQKKKNNFLNVAVAVSVVTAVVDNCNVPCLRNNPSRLKDRHTQRDRQTHFFQTRNSDNSV